MQNFTLKILIFISFNVIFSQNGSYMLFLTPYTIHHTLYTIHRTLILPFKGKEFIIITDVIFGIVFLRGKTHEDSTSRKVLEVTP